MDGSYFLESLGVFSVETYHVADKGESPNVHELTQDKLCKREVVHIDIANDAVSTADYKPDEDPKTYKSVKTGRGPLNTPNWKDNVNPVMTCYKLVTVEFKWWGLQASVVRTRKGRLFFWTLCGKTQVEKNSGFCEKTQIL